MKNHYIVILRKLNETGLGGETDILPLLIKFCKKPASIDIIDWNLQKEKSLKILHDLERHQHAELSSKAILNHLKYNSKQKLTDIWLDDLDVFNAQIMPLGIKYLNEADDRTLIKLSSMNIWLTGALAIIPTVIALLSSWKRIINYVLCYLN